VTAGRIVDAEHGAQAFGTAGAGMTPDTGAADGFRMRLDLRRACTRFRHVCRCAGNRYGKPIRAACN